MSIFKRKNSKDKLPVPSLIEQEVQEENITKELVVYPKEKCQFIDDDGKKCRRYAVGSGNLCERHGGDPLIRANLLADDEIPDILRGKKYDASYHPIEFLYLAKKGYSLVEIAAEFEVPVSELKEWSTTYETFNRTFELGRDLLEAWYLKVGKSNLDNRTFNSPLYQFLTGNQLGWSTKTESKNFNINAGVMIVPGRESESDWENRFKIKKEDKSENQ